LLRNYALPSTPVPLGEGSSSSISHADTPTKSICGVLLPPVIKWSPVPKSNTILGRAGRDFGLLIY
jgi:hypothetical protein